MFSIVIHFKFDVFFNIIVESILNSVQRRSENGKIFSINFFDNYFLIYIYLQYSIFLKFNSGKEFYEQI